MICFTILKPNSWTYSFIEVFGHNLKRVLRHEVNRMDFFNHREGGMVVYQFFLLSPLRKL
jgi:hypothetical protein